MRVIAAGNQMKVYCLFSVLAVVALLPLATAAATAIWDGEGGADMRWNSSSNWLPDTADISGLGVIFSNDAAVSVAGAVNNIVDYDCSISSLSYDQVNDCHTTQINSGKTLTVNGYFRAGVPDDNPGTGFYSTNTVTIRGSVSGTGAMVINAGTNNIVIGSSDDTWDNGARINTVDMQNLGFFSASTTNYFYLGCGAHDPVTLYLAVSNSITAAKLTMGGWNSTDRIYLGQTNVLNIGQITLNGDVPRSWQINGGYAYVQYPGGLVNPASVIRGYDGTGRANMIVGVGGNMNGPNTSVMDFSGGSVDALLGTLIIGQGGITGSGGGQAYGTMKVSAGFVNTTNVIVGYAATNTYASNVGTGEINLSGSGVLGADILTLSDQQGLAAATGKVTLAGGTLKSALIKRGSGTNVTYFNWSGGVVQNRGPGTNLVINADVPLTILSDTNHLFYADSGTTVTVHSVLGGAGTGLVVKAGTGTLLLNGTNTCAASIVVSNGMLGGVGVLAGSLTVKTGAILTPGASTGTLTVQSNLVMEAGATMAITVNGTNDYSRLVVTEGSVSLGSCAITVSERMFPGTRLWIIRNDDILPTSGTFVAIPRAIRIYYNADYGSQALSGGNDVVLVYLAEGTVIGIK